MTNENNLMTTAEAVEYLNIPENTLKTWRC